MPPGAAHHSTPLESPESSSPIVTRSVAAGLAGQFCQAYVLAPWQRAALQLLALLPQAAARFAISRFESLGGLPPNRLVGLTAEALAVERLKDYAPLPGPFPAVTIGAALGGASAHLALALGGPFLPQAFVVTLRGGAPGGDAMAYYRLSAGLARDIALANPSLFTIQHYDPVHDAWMTRHVNHLRLKLLDLPQAYRDFITGTLQPGGAVCYLDCGARWLRFRTDERSIFQVGGWGDISAQEFLQGSERLNSYRRAARFGEADWRLAGFPLEEGPESEWGCEPGLGEALERYCQSQGYRFVRLSLPEPHDYSRLAFQAMTRRLEKDNRQPAGVLVEMFSQFDASAAQLGGLLPVWLVFNTLDSLEFLTRMRSLFPPGKPVFFSPLSTFTLTPDLTPWNSWEEALRGLDWHNIGTRPGHYPADAGTLVNWAEPLHTWVKEHTLPPLSTLSAEELQALAANLQPLQPSSTIDEKST